MVNPNDLAVWQHVVISAFMFFYGLYLTLILFGDMSYDNSFKQNFIMIKDARKMLKECVKVGDKEHEDLERRTIFFYLKAILEKAIVRVAGILGVSFPLYYIALLLLS